MELFRNLRVIAGKSLLARKISKIKRKPFYSNFSNIRSIGIVWDATKTEDFRTLSGFHQGMLDKDIEVKILGYYPGNELPDQYTAIRFFTCLKKRDVDFFYRPIVPETASFTNRHFDVLIDINFKKLFPLYYVTTLCKAGLKVGLTDSKPESSPFDLTISLRNPVSLETYLDQVVYYLKMINSEKEKQVV